MNQVFVWVTIVVLWSILSGVVNSLIGLNIQGWRRWVYDLPAYIAGILVGYYLG